MSYLTRKKMFLYSTPGHTKIQPGLCKDRIGSPFFSISATRHLNLMTILPGASFIFILTKLVCMP